MPRIIYEFGEFVLVVVFGIDLIELAVLADFKVIEALFRLYDKEGLTGLFQILVGELKHLLPVVVSVHILCVFWFVQSYLQIPCQSVAFNHPACKNSLLAGIRHNPFAGPVSDKRRNPNPN